MAAPAADDAAGIAMEIAAAMASGEPLQPFSQRGRPLSHGLAARASAALTELRGGRPVGRKIGFTNRSLWARYGVDAPIWGDVTDATLIVLDEDGAGKMPLAGLFEPRIEPEIALGLARPPTPDMDDAALIACLAFAAPAFELVQSVYPGWRFDTGDAAAANGLHGRLALGPKRAMDAGLAAALPRLTLSLIRDGEVVETGRGDAPLGGPLTALRHLVAALAATPGTRPLAAGEVVTTGTLTDAWPVRPGELWQSRIEGAPFAGLTLRIV